MGILKADRSGVFVQSNLGVANLIEEVRVPARFADDVFRASNERLVVDRGWRSLDSIERQLASFAREPRGVRERTNGNRPLVRRHAAECGAGDQCGPCAQVAGAQRGGGARRTRPDNDDVEVGRHAHRVGASLRPMR